jgi:hypothetical protein
VTDDCDHDSPAECAAARHDSQQFDRWRDVYDRVVARYDDCDAVQRHAARIAEAVACGGASSNTATSNSDLDAESRDVEELMDRKESALADDLQQIAIEYRDAFKRRVRDSGVTEQAVDATLDRLESQFKSKFAQAIADHTGEIRREARQQAIDHNPDLDALVDLDDLDTPSLGNVAVRNRDFEDSLTILVDDLARELLNRSEAAAMTSWRENVRQRDGDGDDQRRQIDRPADSTINGVAGQIGSAGVTEGRDDVAQEAQDNADATLYATRTSVLDSNTCTECRDLDGTTVEVGSDRYNLIAPPARCLGRERCRCYFKMHRGRQLEADFEPKLENDARDVDTVSVWTLILPHGKVQHPAGDFEVTPDWLDDMVAAFDYMRETHGDRPPILRQHEEDGFVWGEVGVLERRDDGLHARLDFNQLATPYVEQGAIERLSPTFYQQWTDPETGKTIGPLLYEVSFVSREHIKSLPGLSDAPRVTNSSYPLDHDMNEETSEETSEESTENAPDQPTPPDGTGEEGATSEPEAEQSIESASTGATFGDNLEAILDDVSVPEGMPGMTRREHLEAVAEGSETSADELDSLIKDGGLVYPTDAIVEAVADWMQVDPENLRKGEVQGFDPGGKMPDVGSDGDDSESDGDDSGGGDGETPSPTENAERELIEENIQLRAANAGVDLDDDTVDDLIELRDHNARLYQRTLDRHLQSTPTENSDDDAPIDEEQGKVGGTPSDGATLRHLCEQAHEEGIGRGAPLLDYVEGEGYSGPAARVSEVAEEVFDG